MRLADYFDAAAEQNPKNLAFVDSATRVNFEQARKTVHAMANALVRARQSGAGCHVAIYSPNDYRVTLLHLGVNLADMAWLSVHIRNTVETNAEVLDYFDANIVFFHSHFESSVPILKARLSKAKRYICIDRPSEHGLFMDDWLADCQFPFPPRTGRPGSDFVPSTYGRHHRAIERRSAHPSLA